MYNPMITNNSVVYSTMWMMFLMPLLTMLTEATKTFYAKLLENIQNMFMKKITTKPNYNKITYTGNAVTTSTSRDIMHIGEPIFNIMRYIIDHNLSKSLLFSSVIYPNSNKKEYDRRYISTDITEIQLVDDIMCCISINSNTTQKENENFNNNIHEAYGDRDTNIDTKSKDIISNLLNITMVLKSKTKNVSEIKEFVEEQIEYYEKKDKNMDNNKYHFIYSGGDTRNVSSCIKTLLSNDKHPDNQTFGTLFFDHKEQIIKMIDKMDDTEYFKKTGKKRKVGLLFNGEPGCGKTSCIKAIADKYNRHILEIPMSIVKTNKDLRDILNLNLSYFNDVSGCIENTKTILNNNNTIILFDEIDQQDELMNRNKKTNNPDDKNSTMELMLQTMTDAEKKNFMNMLNPDSVNLGCVLSMLDGIDNYDGLIIIATTNCIDKLDPALYRHGRLTPIRFTYSRREDIKDIIELHFQTKLTPEQIATLPDRHDKITPAKLVYLTQKYEDRLPDLLKKLEKYKSAPSTP